MTHRNLPSIGTWPVREVVAADPAPVYNTCVAGYHNSIVRSVVGLRSYRRTTLASGTLAQGDSGGTSPKRTLNDPLPSRPKKPTEANPHAPDLEATGPHTVIGTRTDPKASPAPYRQGITYDAEGNPVGRIDVTTHGRFDHPKPHWHPYDPTIQNPFDRASPGNFGPARPMPE